MPSRDAIYVSLATSKSWVFPCLKSLFHNIFKFTLPLPLLLNKVLCDPNVIYITLPLEDLKTFWTIQKLAHAMTWGSVISDSSEAMGILDDRFHVKLIQ